MQGASCTRSLRSVLGSKIKSKSTVEFLRTGRVLWGVETDALVISKILKTHVSA